MFETLNLIQTGKMPAVPVVLVGRAYWDRLINFDFLVEEGTIDPDDRALVRYADTAADAWSLIRGWYAEHGNPEFPREPVATPTPVAPGPADLHWPDSPLP